MKSLLAFIILTCIVTKLAVAAVAPSEKDALTAIYQQTDGANWLDNSNWLVDDPCENLWSGITCDSGNTTVIGIELWFNGLTGQLPAEIGNFPNLEYLWLSDNYLQGPVPEAIGNLEKLVDLDLSWNLLSGQIPASLGQLQNLQYLWLFDNQFSSSIPATIGNMMSLVDLDLSFNNLEGTIPSELGQLSQLQYLSLWDNRITSPIPTELSNLNQLLTLDLENNLFSGSFPVFLTQLSSLRTLYASHNQFSGNIPPELGQMNQLINLYMSNNQLEGNIPAEVGNMVSLVNLYMNNNQLSGSIPPQLADLSQLRRLVLDNNQLSGTLPDLSTLSNLERLDLASNHLSGSLPDNLHLLGKLERLYASQNHFSGNLPETLGQVTVLKSLTLDGNNFSGPVPDSFANLINLGGGLLNIHYNRLYTHNASLDTFLDQRCNCNWSSTQTHHPDAFSLISASSNSISIGWNRIEYQLDQGHYRIYAAQSPSGPWSHVYSSSTKTVNQAIINALEASTPYYFQFRTQTDPHKKNKNTLFSDASGTFVANTTGEANIEIDLWITIERSSALLPTGQFTEYVIKAGNLDPNDSNSAHINHLLPSLITNTSWTCQEVNGASCTSASGTGDIQETVLLPANSHLVYTLNTQVGSLERLAPLAASIVPGTQEIDNNLANNETGLQVPIGIFADGLEQ